MPIAVRKWWIGRTNKQLKTEAEEREKAAKEAQHRR